MQKNLPDHDLKIMQHHREAILAAPHTFSVLDICQSEVKH